MDDLAAALTVTPVGPDRFVSHTRDWWGGTRTYGGLVVAQAVSAAVRTVDPSVRVHSLHGYFLGSPPQGRPVDIVVSRVRDGRSFSVREVTSSVDGRETFKMLCSFHAEEAGDEYQLAMPEGVPDPEEIEPADIPAPLDVRELGWTAPEPDGTYRSTQRAWMRTKEPLPDDPAVQAAAVAYLTDLTHSSYRPNSLGTWGTHRDASLDHALWFHRPVRADEWLLYDLQAVANAGGLATVRGALFGRDGVLRVSMVQEVLIRPLATPRPRRSPVPGRP